MGEAPDVLQRLKDANFAVYAAGDDAEAGRISAGDTAKVLAQVRTMTATLEYAELQLLHAAREQGVTWTQLAEVLGLRGRQGAQKRYADLGRRHSWSPPPKDGTPADGGRPTSADYAAAMQRAVDGGLDLRTAAPGDVDEVRQDARRVAGEAVQPVVHDDEPAAGPEPWTPEGRAISDREYSATLKHRPLPDRGKDWTFTVDGDHAAVWYKRGTKAGSAEKDWPQPGWIAKNGAAVRIGPAQPSRVKALQYAADRYEHNRRQETPAGKDRPLPADGWAVRQTLADRDENRWQVIGPDGGRAGTVQPSYQGASTWSAACGSTTVTPMTVPGSAGGAAHDGQDWRTMTAAALAVAWWATDGETPTPGEAAKSARREPAAPAPASWTATESLPGADGWQLARTQRDVADGRWQVVAPDGTVAGYVAQNAVTASGGRAWEAVSGDLREDSSPLVRVSPGPDDVHAAPDGAWSSRDIAAIAVAYRADQWGVPSPDLAAMRAETDALRAAAPKITDRVIRDGLFECRKSASYENTGAWDVLVGGKPAGSVRPTWRGSGGVRGWEPVDLAGTQMGVYNIGRTTPGGHAASRDAAAVALLHGLQRRQEEDRKQRRQATGLTAVPDDNES